MEKYVSVTLMGGLGNNLFSLAHAFAYGKRNNRKCVIYEPNILRAYQHSDEHYENTIFRNYERVSLLYQQEYKEPSNEYFICRQVPPTDVQHLHLYGYFQHEDYFIEYKDEFIASLDFPFDKYNLFENTCFIHVRRGDYLEIPLHYVNFYDGYLDVAMEYVRQKKSNVRFIVFSNDPEWCKEYYKFQIPDVTISYERSAIATLVMMSKCEVGGICWNSSFSWWGAYINPNPDKIVIFPKTWMNNYDSVEIQFKGSIVLDY